MNIKKLMHISRINNLYGEQLDQYSRNFDKNMKDILTSEDIERFRNNMFYHDWKINKEVIQYVNEAFPVLSIEIRNGKKRVTTFVFNDVLVYEKKLKLGTGFVSHMEDIIDCYVGKREKRICCGIVLASGTWMYVEAKHLILKSTDDE